MSIKSYIKSPGALILSLDFELIWGVFDKINHQEKRGYFVNTKKVIPRILQLFEKYDIHCTWATVGMLFNKNWDEWKGNVPEIIPEYGNEKLNAYIYANSLDQQETQDICFAPELIDLISSKPTQEIATHTYSHYYCQENGQNSKMFRSDIEKAIELARSFNIELNSLVFPRNQFNENYVQVCQDLGIKNIRTNPTNWYWKNPERGTLAQKLFRSGDAYLGSSDKLYDLQDLKFNSDKVVHQKASRMLRPFSNNNILEFFKLKRIIGEMSYAAKYNKLYHLWWHPHNFGEFPEESIVQLETMLRHYQYCNEKYGFESLTMSQVGERFEQL